MKIILIGAYGYTGTIICELLEKQSIQFTAAGRQMDKLNLLKAQFQSVDRVIAVDICDSIQIQKLISEFDVILNCAGPFTEESTNLVNHIANSKSKFYLDISGEIGFVRESYEKNNEAAVANGTTIVHGCAFESLVADLTIRILKNQLGELQDVKTFYAFQHSKPSPGTRMTMKLSKFRKLYRITNSVWKEINTAEEKEPVSFDGVNYMAVAYPLPEIAFSFWNYKPENAMSYLLLSKEEAMFVGVPEQLQGSVENELEKLKQRKTAGPTAEERANQKCQLVVQVKNKIGVQKSILLEGSDMYLMTAKAMVYSLSCLISTSNTHSGVISPTALFKDQEAETLIELGIGLKSL